MYMRIDIKKIRTSIIVKTYLITFEYETRKGYRREQQRLLTVSSIEDPEEIFNNWAKNCRTISNAKILGIVEIKEEQKKIDL
ncbi:hypothetical protein ABHA39_12490 [Clostridium paraputrificum]|uniref:hypothetical protein n=2 Tax=Clostridium TaxID=1485 RepID=UPI0011789A2C|nr:MULTISPECIES: hypothetical protein [Clostridium]MDU1994752.1 hypothetical protein [Clostridium sp.]MDU6048411.1 hypothetical protein [Clostridium sp.]MDU6222468.1 hypothetical protein [Clostridium sp.]